MTRECSNCATPTSNKKFCSKSCAAKVNNRLHPKRSPEGNPCPCCGTVVASYKKFCGSLCFKKHQREQYIARWLEGLESGSQTKGEISAYVRGWLRDQHGDRCWICSWAEVREADGKVPVQVDHIDGDFSNNTPENLRLLCPNCHSLTSNWGRLNTSGGRKYRYR